MSRALALLSLVALLTGTAWAGYRAGWAASETSAARVVAQARRAASTASVRVVTRYVAQAGAVQTRYRTLEQDVAAYVSPETDRLFRVPWGFVRLHDAAAAAAGVLPGAADATDATASPFAASAVLGIVLGNYRDCEIDRAELLALQDWLRTVSPSPQNQGDLPNAQPQGPSDVQTPLLPETDRPPGDP